ncbi:GGDEF domain-containing protein [Comamonas badia]|uniref:GGDEF domain-containing protein n=1 Tax=Comamonas badia TaxID=265291 RepID=UPI000422B41D|nr:diguanylate cyclase [Comamonas badia]
MMRTAFVWDESFATGLPEMDGQHRELVNLFNGLGLALFVHGVQDEGPLADAFDRLLRYTESHFAEEEALMRRMALDPRFIASHLAAHTQFVEHLQAIWGQRASLPDLRVTLTDFLTSWMALHILGADQSLARQVRAVEQGRTPAQAFEDEGEPRDAGTRVLTQLVTRLYNALISQNRQLALANQQLEERVAERTRALEEANQALRAMVRTDGLLGIANRAHFDERIEQACSLAWRQERHVGLLMIDLDHFKRYNDWYGHRQGDICLQVVVRAVAGVLKRDTDLLARYGGEELVVVLPDTDREGSVAVAERVLQAVRALQLNHADSPVAPYVTVSIGVCSRVPAPADPSRGGSGAAGLIACADEALYRAKGAGRDRSVLAEKAVKFQAVA